MEWLNHSCIDGTMTPSLTRPGSFLRAEVEGFGS